MIGHQGAKRGAGVRGRRAGGRAAWCAAVAACAWAGSARGQTWTGGGITNNWSTTANWSGGAPVNNGTATVTFAGTTRLTPNQDSTYSIAALNFSATAGAFALAGNPLTVNAGGISSASASSVTVGNLVTAGASQTWMTGAGSLTFNNGLMGLGGNTVTVSGTGSIVVTGVVSGTAATAFAVNSGTLSFNGSTSNTFPGAVNVNGGQLQLGRSGVSVPGALRVGDGVGAANTAVVNFNVNGQLTANSAVTVNSDGYLNDGGAFTPIGPLAMAGGTISIGGQLTLNGDVTVTGTQASVITATDDNLDVSLGGAQRTFNVALGNNYADLDMLNIGLTNGSILKTGAGSMRIGGPKLGSFGGVTLQQGTLLLAGSNCLGGGSLTLAGGTLAPDNGGGPLGNTLVLNNPVSLTGDTSVSATGGGLAVQFAGTFTATGNRTLSDVSSNSSGSPGITFSGLLNATGAGNSLTFTDTHQEPVAISGVASGTFTVGQNVTLAVTGQLLGTATISSTATLEVDGGLIGAMVTNQGFISFGTGNAINFGGGLTNQAYIDLTDGQSLTAGGTGLNNQFFLSFINATVGGSGVFANYGSLSGYGTISGTGSFVNYGYFYQTNGFIGVAEAGGSFNYGSMILPVGLNLAAGDPFTNSGMIQPQQLIPQLAVTIYGPGPLTNAAGGTIVGPILIQAPFVNQAGGTLISNTGTLTVTTPFTNNGVMQLESSTASFTGGAITNTGTIQGVGVVSNPVSNTGGVIEATRGTLGIFGGLSNGAGGTLVVDAGAKLLVSPGLGTNAGVISLIGGTYDNGGAALNNTGNITGYGVLRTGGTGLTNNGVVTLTGGTTTVNGPVTNTASHNFRIQYNPAIFSGFFQNNGSLVVTGTTATFGGGGSGLPSGGPVPTESLALVGTGTTTLSSGANVATDGIVQGGLTLQGTAASPSSFSVATREPTGMTPSTGRAVGQSISVVGSLFIASGTSGYLGNMDLGDNDLVLTATPETTARAYIAAWYAGGARSGLGLSSSRAGSPGGPDVLATLGELANSDGRGGSLYATFDGVGVTSSAVLVKYTYLGDTNLDGMVDGQDLANLLAGMDGGLGGWVNGDVNYDGKVDGTDFGLLLASLRSQGAPFGGGDGLGGSVPEPGVLGVGVGMVGLARRRR